MTEPTDSLADQDDALAAEYSLGVLGQAERGHVAQRVMRDAAFADRVAAWDARLSGFNEAYQPETPRPVVKTAIDKRLFGGPSQRVPFFRRLWLWQFLATAATVALALAVFYPPAPPAGPEPAPPALLVASLTAVDTDVQFVALYGDIASVIRVAHIAGDPRDAHDFELWLIEEGADPISLGLVGPGTAHTPVPDTLVQAIGAGDRLAVTLEPVGGAPDGSPTGPVIAAGSLTAL